jgi:hypothetical protein
LEVVCFCGTYVGFDVPEEVTSSRHFCFFSEPWASYSDVVTSSFKDDDPCAF